MQIANGEYVWPDDVVVSEDAKARTAHAPRTHRARPAHAPRTPRARTAHAPRTHRARTAHAPRTPRAHAPTAATFGGGAGALATARAPPP